MVDSSFGVSGISVGILLPSSLAAIQAVCGSHRRATAVALMLFSGNVLGAGLGPVLTGAMSDALTLGFGTDALSFAMMLGTGLLLPISYCFFRSASYLPKDLEP